MQNYEKNGNKVAKNQSFVSFEEQAKRDKELRRWLFDLNDYLIRLTNDVFFDECIEETATAFFETLEGQTSTKEVATTVMRVLFAAKKIKAHINNPNDNSEAFTQDDEKNGFIYSRIFKSDDIAQALEIANNHRKYKDSVDNYIEQMVSLKSVEHIILEMEKECIDLIEVEERLINYIQRLKEVVAPMANLKFKNKSDGERQTLP